MTYVTENAIWGLQAVRVLRRRSTNHANLQGYLPRGSTTRSERKKSWGTETLVTALSSRRC